MSGYKKKTNKIWVILAVVIVLIGAIGGIGYLTNWFTSDVKTFMVEMDGRRIVRDCTGLTIESGASFEIKNISDGADYDVKIYASGTETNDFSFYLGKEKTSWQEIKNDDFTSAFDIEKSKSGFVLSYESIRGILKKRYVGFGIYVETKPEDLNNLFLMIITSGDSKISLGFTLSDFEVSSGPLPLDYTITFDENSHVF